MKLSLRIFRSLWLPATLISSACFAGVGCSASPMGMAMHVVGEVVNDADVMDKEKEFVGGRVSAVDEKLGQPIDSYQDVNSKREWRVYSPSLDVTGFTRYVIEVANGKVLAITKTKKFGDPAIGVAQQTIAFQKVEGKSPGECERSFGRSAMLTLRNKTSNQLVQLYDARLIDIEGVTKPDYYVLRFDATPRCTSLNVVAVSATTKAEPTR